MSGLVDLVVLTDALLSYAVPAALITMLPGPDTAMVLATAIRGGPAAAMRAAWGVGTGLLLWGVAAAAGLAAALRSSAVIYDLFRVACVAYLLVLAAHAVAASRRQTPDASPAARHGGARDRQLPSLGWGYRRALLTCALNPKLGVFFVVVLPQFIPSGAPVASTSVALAALQALEAVLWYFLLSRLAGRMDRVLAKHRVRAWLDRFTAAVLIAFAVRLATESTP